MTTETPRRTGPPGSSSATEELEAPPAHGWGDPFDPTGEAAALAAMRPSAALVAALEELDHGAVTDAVVLEAIAAWERVKAHADATLSRLYVSFVDRVSADPLLPASQALRHATAEVASRLAISEAAASRRLDTAIGIEKQPGLGDALGAGRIDMAKVQVLLRETDHLPRHRATAVIDHFIPQGQEFTPTQLRDRIRKTLQETDPDTAAVRHAKARDQRSLWREAAPDGMATLHVLDTATNIEAAYSAIATMAGPKSSTDSRTAGARRTDTLITLLTGGTSQSQHTEAAVGEGAPAATPGTDEGPATPGGAGDLLAAVLERLPQCTVNLDVTVGAGTLLGLDDRPGFLAGYGPIPADLSRQVARDATWRQILTCPETGEFLHRASRSYRPGLVLAAAVRSRDVTCTFPGCQRPAVACDLDHVKPFDRSKPAAAQTCMHNLHPLCRHHHLIKTHGRWAVHRDPVTGITRWTSPTRHQYQRPPAVLAGHPPAELPDTGPPSDEEKPGGPPLFEEDLDDETGLPVVLPGGPDRVPKLPAPYVPPPDDDEPMPAALAEKPRRSTDERATGVGADGTTARDA